MAEFMCGIGETLMIVSPLIVRFVQAITINRIYGKRLSIAFSIVVFLILGAASTPMIASKLSGCWSGPPATSDYLLAGALGVGMYLLGFFGFRFHSVILDALKSEP